MSRTTSIPSVFLDCICAVQSDECLYLHSRTTGNSRPVSAPNLVHRFLLVPRSLLLRSTDPGTFALYLDFFGSDLDRFILARSDGIFHRHSARSRCLRLVNHFVPFFPQNLTNNIQFTKQAVLFLILGIVFNDDDRIAIKCNVPQIRSWM